MDLEEKGKVHRKIYDIILTRNYETYFFARADLHVLSPGSKPAFGATPIPNYKKFIT